MPELLRSRPKQPRTALLFAVAGGAFATTLASALANPPRRAQLRNRVSSAASDTLDLMGKAARDARNRISGAAAAAKGAVRGDEPSDEKLVARVRTKLGRLVSHPHAVEVKADHGHVTLSGPILASEVDLLVREVRRVRGVREVETTFEVHEHADVPSLQGAGHPPRAPEIFQEHWTPSLRVGAGALGVAAALYGVSRLPSPIGVGVGSVGLLLVARAAFDKPIGCILGFDETRRAIELHKSMTIHAPVDEVFSYLSDFERYPDFMDHVDKVIKTGEQRSHWHVRGPFGGTVEWEAETTSFVPNEQIAWRSVDESRIKHEGTVHFAPADDGHATRIEVDLGYTPVAGYLGHGVAVLFGVDPKKLLDDDLLRVKSLLEEGKARAHGHQVTRKDFSAETTTH